MTKKQLPTPAELRKLLRYEPETGKLFWRVKPRKNIPSGAIAGNMKANGYMEFALNGSKMYQHRAIWAMCNDKWPGHQIDHINGIRNDNRIENLRTATPQENNRNSKLSKNNKSGVTGVFWSARMGKWCAQITINYKGKHLGVFDDMGDAIAARKAAEIEYFGEFAYG